jgi:hypothetical protein
MCQLIVSKEEQQEEEHDSLTDLICKIVITSSTLISVGFITLWIFVILVVFVELFDLSIHPKSLLESGVY